MPRYFRTLIPALLALCALILTGSQTRAQMINLTNPPTLSTPYVNDGTGVVFPVELAGFRLIRLTDFETKIPGLGVGITYRNDSPLFTADIYIYNKGIQVPSGHQPQAIKAEFEQMIGEIQAIAAQGYYTNVKTGSAPAPCRAANIDFQCVGFDYLGVPPSRTPTRSLLLIRGIKGNFFKVRVSWPQAQHAQAKPIVDRFVEAFGKSLPN